jgi:hypothetical protein
MRHSANRYREQAHAYSGVSLRSKPAYAGSGKHPGELVQRLVTQPS